MIDRVRHQGHVAFLAIVSFLPTLVLSNGTYNADTKLYLTTNAGRLISQSRYAWDPSQFAGYVPHQAIGYLWPMGPFYWLFDLVGLPGWLAQRGFVATLFFFASLGVLRLVHHLGFPKSAALVAAVAYQFTPYVLAYQSRTSAMLLPWCGLPWIILAVEKGLRSSSWRQPALIAVIVASIGGINATSLIMIAIAPILYILDAVTSNRCSRSEATRFTLRTMILCTMTSLWWIAMVAIQGRYGADVLAYSETLEAVSSTSVSTEVFRGLGYWLNYVATPTYTSTSRALLYLDNVIAVALSYFVPMMGAIGIAFVRSRARRVVSWWLLAGVVLAVGVYPVDNSSVLTRLLASNPESSISLALRSSTRAIPVLNLAIVIGVASLVTVIQEALSSRHSTGWQVPRALVVPVALAICVMVVPSRMVHGIGDQAVGHEALPSYWSAAGSRIETRLGDDARALQLPGQEFGAYSWGYTVDPALAGATATPILTRDLLPLGNPQTMDFMNAVDDAARAGQIDDGSWERLATRLGAGAIVVPRDLDSSRFGTYSARALEQRIGSKSAEVFGSDNESVSVRFTSSASIARINDRLTIVEGSGEGLVQIARSGIRTGVVQYASDMSEEDIESAIESGASLVITDSNRIQARHWRGSLDTLGYSEDSVNSDLRIRDVADRRLPLFELESDESHTTVAQVGDVRVTSSSYGYPLGYWPETRPAMAVDGRADTAWTTGFFSNPVGESISLITTSPVRTIKLIQPDHSRWISKVAVRLDTSSTWTGVSLQESERLTGQTIDLARSATRVTIRIEEVRNTTGVSTGGFGAFDNAVDGVGFSELITNMLPIVEETHLPSRSTRIATKIATSGARGTGVQPTYVFSRQRAPHESWWRSDPEREMNRSFMSLAGSYTLVIRGHLDITDEMSSSKFLGVTTFAEGAVSSGLSHAGWFSTDNDPSTSWRVRYGKLQRPTLVFRTSTAMDNIALVQCKSDDCNSVTRVVVTDDRGTSVDRSVRGGSVDVRGLRAGTWRLSVVETTGRKLKDTRFGGLVEAPIEIFEINGKGVQHANPAFVPGGVDSKVVISINGKDVTAPLDDVDLNEDGQFRVEATVDLVDGLNSLRSLESPLRVDDVVLSPLPANSLNDVSSLSPYKSLEISGSPTRRHVELPPHESGSWFVFAEGYSVGWSASLDGQRLETHRQVDGGFNGWLLPGSNSPASVVLSFEPQRLASAAQIISLLFFLLCCAVLTKTSMQRLDRLAEGVIITGNWRMSLRRRFIAGGATILVSFIVVPPSAFAVSLIAGGLILLVRTTRQSLVIATLFVSYSIIRVTAKVLLDDPPARFDWPATMAAYHAPLMVGLVALTILVTLTSRREAAN